MQRLGEVNLMIDSKILRKTVIPLEYKQKKEQIDLSKSKEYIELTKCNDLLTKNFYEETTQLTNLTSEIKMRMEIIQSCNNIFQEKHSIESINKILGYLSTSFASQMPEDNELIKNLKDILSGSSTKISDKSKIQSLIDKLSKYISTKNDEILEKSNDLQKNFSLQIKLTDTLNVFSCNCGNIFLETLPSNKKCPFCNENLDIRNCQKGAINVLSEDFKKFIEYNIWLEEGVAKIFRKHDFQTFVRLNIKGKSGIYHEVDILAHTKNIFLVAECKNTDIKLENVYSTFSKSIDIGTHSSFLIGVGECKDDALKFGKTHNIVIIPNILEKISILELEKKIEEVKNRFE